jgi:RND family efflux transporter MFP subunit
MLRFAVGLTLALLIGLVLMVPNSAPSYGAAALAQGPDEAEADSASEEQADKEEEKSDEPAEEKAPSNGEATKDKPESADDKQADDEDKAGKEDKESADTKADAKPEEKATEKADAKKETKKKRKTLKVEAKRMKIDLPLDGTFVAREMKEVPLRPEAWSDFEIVEVVALGAKVHPGEVLIKFDDRKFNEAIADLELEQRLNEIAIVKAEEELPRLEKTLTMDLAQAERGSKEAQEDFGRYTEIERPMTVKSAEFMAKYYQFMLDYEQDELDQLKKMYEADDLTEETEEIVLKRQKNSVEFAEFSLESAKLNRDETLNVRLPRYDVEIKESLERTALALARAKMAFQQDLNTARYQLEQRKQARAKSLDRHAKLTQDRGLMEIKAPVDGVVYYGPCVNGKWGETASLINKYRPKNSVMPGSVLMTIVELRPLYVTATFDESKRPDVAVGQKAKISPPAEGSERVGGKVQEISPIPVSSGKFEITLELEQEAVPAWVVAGMSCKLKINTYDEAEALVVPKTAVHTDKEDEDQQYAWVVDPEDDEAKPERRNVKIGRRSGDDVEIVKGLKPGDVISLDDEDAKKDEKEKEQKDEKDESSAKS